LLVAITEEIWEFWTFYERKNIHFGVNGNPAHNPGTDNMESCISVIIWSKGSNIAVKQRP